MPTTIGLLAGLTPASLPLAGTDLFGVTQGGNSRGAEGNDITAVADYSGAIDLFRNNIFCLMCPGSNTFGDSFGGQLLQNAFGGTNAVANAVTNMYTRAKRANRSTGSLANNVAVSRSSGVNPMVYVGNGAGRGGFRFVTRFGIAQRNTTQKFVIGLSSTTNISDVEPTTLTNLIGVGVNTGDTDLQLYCAGSAAQPRTSLGSGFPANTTQTDWYEFELVSAGADLRDIDWTLRRLNTGASTGGNLTGAATVVPGETVGLGFYILVGNGSVGGVVSADLGHVFLEGDNS